MGIYNTIHFINKAGEKTQIQSKNGEPALYNYEIGNPIDIEDGIYFTQDGSFVVYNGKIAAAFDSEEPHLYDKWDRLLEYPDLNSINPLAHALKQIQDDYSRKTEKS